MYSSSPIASPNYYYQQRRTNNQLDQSRPLTDLIIEPLGDLVVANGDLMLTWGTDAVIKSLLRRLYTPPQGYRRWTNSYRNGPQELNTSYGDPVYNYLSAPLTNNTYKEIFDSLTQTVSKDSNITLLSIEQQSSIESGVLSLLVRYKLSDQYYSLQANLYSN